MWTASLDHLFRRGNGQWSLHSRLDPVIDVWHKSLELRPFLQQPCERTADTPEGCPEPRQEACCSYQCSAASERPTLVDFATAPLYLKRPFIDRYYLIGESSSKFTLKLSKPHPQPSHTCCCGLAHHLTECAAHCTMQHAIKVILG